MENYKVVNLLKESYICKVFLAFRQEDNTEVILKEVKTQFIDSQFDSRFYAWAEKLLNLSHPNLVDYIDFVCEGGRFAFVTEDSNFSSIYDLFDDADVDELKIYNIFTQILKATAYAHSQDVLNGEFDFDHILVENDRVLIEDYGIKNILFPSLNLVIRQDNIDIYNFYSPEQFTEEQITASSDIFSLGALLYAMTERKMPFSQVSGFENLRNVMNQTEYLEASEGNLFAPFIRRATMLNPQDRYESVEQWLGEWIQLEEILAQATINTRETLIEQITTQEEKPILPGNKVKREEKILDEIKVKSKRRFTILIVVLLLFFVFFARLFVHETFFNPQAYNFVTGKYLDRVFIVQRSSSLLDLIAPSEGQYVFDLRVDLDSGEIVSSNVVDYRHSKLGGVSFTGDDIILVGGNSPNNYLTFPVLTLIRSRSYEPYYITDENGFYVDVVADGCDLYLLKYLYSSTIEHARVVVEKRDCRLNKLFSFALEGDVLQDSLVPRNLMLMGNLIIIELYSFSDRTIKLVALDQKGYLVWQQQISSAPVSWNDTWFNIDVAGNRIWVAVLTNKRKCRIALYAFDTNGKEIAVIKFYPGTMISSIDRLRALDNGMLLLSIYTRRNFSLVYGFNSKGKLFLRKRFGFFDKVRITDVYPINDKEIVLAGISRNLLMTDTVNAQNIYLLRMSLLKGKIEQIPFSQEYLVTGNQ